MRGEPGGHHHRQRADGDHQAVSLHQAERSRCYTPSAAPCGSLCVCHGQRAGGDHQAVSVQAVGAQRSRSMDKVPSVLVAPTSEPGKTTKQQGSSAACCADMHIACHLALSFSSMPAQPRCRQHVCGMQHCHMPSWPLRPDPQVLPGPQYCHPQGGVKLRRHRGGVPRPLSPPNPPCLGPLSTAGAMQRCRACRPSLDDVLALS